MQAFQWQVSRTPGVYQYLGGVSDLQGVTHAFSTRRGGCSLPPFDSLNLGAASGDDPRTVDQNRRIFLESMGLPNGQLRTLKQHHSCDVLLIQGDPPPEGSPPAGDAQITDRPDLVLGVLTADCYPILLVDPRRRVVAAVHAGWRGTAGGIVSRTLERMNRHWQCQGRDLIALIGPGIGRCCYQVGVEVYESYVREQPAGKSWFVADRNAEAQGPRWRLDLLSANRQQLEDGGLQAQRIFCLGECTACRSERYFSYRRDGAATGRMLSVICLAASG